MCMPCTIQLADIKCENVINDECCIPGFLKKKKEKKKKKKEKEEKEAQSSDTQSV